MSDEVNTRSRRETFMRFAPLVLWVGVIFFLSSDQGSMAHTSRFIGPLLHFLFPTAPEETIELYHFYIRKAAHVTEYAILALLAWRALSRSIRFCRWLLPMGLVVLIASIDEFNQSFEPSRGSSPYDVLLDISGALAALIVLSIIIRLRRSDV